MANSRSIIFWLASSASLMYKTECKSFLKFVSNSSSSFSNLCSVKPAKKISSSRANLSFFDLANLSRRSSALWYALNSSFFWLKNSDCAVLFFSLKKSAASCTKKFFKIAWSWRYALFSIKPSRPAFSTKPLCSRSAISIAPNIRR